MTASRDQGRRVGGLFLLTAVLSLAAAFGLAACGGGEAAPTGPDGDAAQLTFVQTSAGDSHTCGVTPAEEAFCWGRNSDGQLGDGTTTERTTPVAVDVSGLATQTFARVSAGGRHTCGVTTAEEVFCWGRNSQGQLGDGTTTERTTPEAVLDPASGAVAWARVSAGPFHTCGVTTAEEAFCWGFNNEGQLGDGTTTSHTTPEAVLDPASGAVAWARVSAGGSHTCGVTTAEEAFCWGRSSSGQLGDGTTTDSSTPEAVLDPASGAVAWARVSAGGNHTCGVPTAEEPFCWGSNFRGQLGDGTTTSRSSPVAVDISALSTKTFGAVSGGGGHTCGVTTAEEAFCWGFNGNGQLGDGTTTDSSTPVRVVQ